MNSRTSIKKMGKHIADLRKQKGYTQRTLADILDICDKTISKWESGIIAPDVTILQTLANALDVPVEEIIAGEEVKDFDTIEALDVYSNMTKNRLIKTFVIFVLLLLIVVFFIFRVEEYYSWHLDSLVSDGDIALKGYILMNNKETKIIVNEFYFSNKDLNYKIKKINLIVKNQNDTIYNENSSFDKPIDINEFLNNYVISIESKTKINKKDLTLYFIIDEDNGKKKTYNYAFE